MNALKPLQPADPVRRGGIFTRIVLSLAAMILFGVLNRMLAPASTLLSAESAGGQFSNSDIAAVSTSLRTYVFGYLGLPLVILLALLIAIWWAPARRFFAVGACLACLAVPGTARAYYDKTDFTEAYTILPNESGFWIPDQGANRDTQAQFESEAYLNANRVALKRFIVPHAKLSGSGSFFDFYVPTGRLIIVDRTPYSREWVDASDRGTSQRREGFPCQSKEGLNISVGVSIGVSVAELNAAKYLYHFGVLAPAGDRTDPRVIFNSVYYSRKLADVMDDVGRKKVQTLVCGEISARIFDKDNEDASQIIDNVKQSAAAYFNEVGITLDFIGWADTFTFDRTVQDAVNRRYIAAQDAAIASQLAPYASTIQALAAAEALRAFGQKTDGRLPTTIVGLPPEVGPLMSTLLKSVPAAPAQSPVH
jgi:hypothetical protein